MNEGEKLLEAITKDPTDWSLRLIYSDWLEENGLPFMAEAMRWLSENKRHPFNSIPKEVEKRLIESGRTETNLELSLSIYKNQEGSGFWWAQNQTIEITPEYCVLPHDLWLRLPNPHDYDPGCYKSYKTAKQAEEAFMTMWHGKRLLRA